MILQRVQGQWQMDPNNNATNLWGLTGTPFNTLIATGENGLILVNP